MTTSVSNAARSLNGCWTCRVRKKKCDENRPLCSTCASLQLHCHGYGPRPDWMDKGVLQREQAVNIRRIVSQTKSKRRRRQLSRVTQSPHNPRQELNPLSSEKVSSLTFPWLSPAHKTAEIPFGNALQDKFQFQSGDEELITSNEPLRSASFYSTIFPAELSFNEEGDIGASDRRLLDATMDSENTDQESDLMPCTFPSGEPTLIPLTISPRKTKIGWNNDASKGHTLYDIGKDTPANLCDATSSAAAYEEGQLPSDLTYLHQMASVSATETNFSHPRTVGNLACSSAGSNKLPIWENSDDMLLMLYLDEVFYIQYPFYRLSNTQGRGWLFSILRRDKSTYHAALALGEYYQQSIRPRSSDVSRDTACLRAEGGHYNLALREMQRSIEQSHTWSDTPGLVRSVETLTCILQLLFWELFSGGTENWQTHLGAAAILVPALVRSQMASATQDSIGSGQGFGQQNEKSLQSEGDTVASFLLGSFAWFDIIACASTRSSSFLRLDHKVTLELAGIHLESLAGCENWVMIFILEISFLDKWKKDAEKGSKLSVIELAKRGGQIEERLRDRLADMENKSLTASSSRNTSGMPSASTPGEVTKIFALAAMTYLHVVVSGAHPELPEIVESVSKTIIAFQSLADAKLLRNLVWPFCISGCLALEREHTFFRGFISTAGINQSTIGTCFEAFKIMEECWETRKGCSYNCDWVFVMNKRGHHVLLA